MIFRFTEQCGAVAAEVNHFEGKGVEVWRLGTPDEYERMGERGLRWIARQEGIVLYERQPG